MVFWECIKIDERSIQFYPELSRYLDVVFLDKSFKNFKNLKNSIFVLVKQFNFYLTNALKRWPVYDASINHVDILGWKGVVKLPLP